MNYKITPNWITGYAYRGYEKTTVKVPIIMSGPSFPDVPGVITIDGDYFVCVSTTPVRYEQAVCLPAEKL